MKQSFLKFSCSKISCRTGPLFFIYLSAVRAMHSWIFAAPVTELLFISVEASATLSLLPLCNSCTNRLFVIVKSLLFLFSSLFIFLVYLSSIPTLSLSLPHSQSTVIVTLFSFLFSLSSWFIFHLYQLFLFLSFPRSQSN